MTNPASKPIKVVNDNTALPGASNSQRKVSRKRSTRVRVPTVTVTVTVILCGAHPPASFSLRPSAKIA